MWQTLDKSLLFYFCGFYYLFFNNDFIILYIMYYYFCASVFISVLFTALFLSAWFGFISSVTHFATLLRKVLHKLSLLLLYIQSLATSLGKPEQSNWIQYNSSAINCIHFQFLLTLSFYFMFITEVMLSGGGVLRCIILTAVPNILLPSCMLMKWTKYQEHHSI